jgi:uncharacterized repeat protein (TIGR03803 family)
MKRLASTLGKSDWAKRTLVVFGLFAAAIALPAQTFTILHSFNGADGIGSWGAVVQGTDGALYGTTYYGGYGGGTVFRMTRSGTLTTLYSFCSQSGCPDGSQPRARLGETPDGNFYSTTSTGGLSDCESGCGTVYEITPSGVLTTLHLFNGADGADPTDGLVPAANGYLYATTVQGGTSACLPFAGCGTVFRITPSGALTSLHSFTGLDGSQVYARVVQANNEEIYGTASGGDNNACTGGCGTVYKMTPSGTVTTLHSFNGADGAMPVGGLIQAANGDLYGETEWGGANKGGTVFAITPGGVFRTVYSFCSQANCTDGRSPSADMVQANDGNFYGTTHSGGSEGSGTIFKITPHGTLTTLYNFCSQTGCVDGGDPQGGITQATNGDFYGTTLRDGANQNGTVYSLSVGLGPFVKTLPTMGAEGTVVEILGDNLSATSSVAFNGTAAVFTVNSTGTGIRTTVPSGATTGAVQVTTPGAVLSSNVPFKVLP